jgi:hypothetical protein
MINTPWISGRRSPLIENLEQVLRGGCALEPPDSLVRHSDGGPAQLRAMDFQVHLFVTIAVAFIQSKLNGY